MIIAHQILLPAHSLFAADRLSFVVGCAFACADEAAVFSVLAAAVIAISHHGS